MICSNLYVIAAICGNFWRESTVNPGIWESLTVGAPGYGLGQWTDIPPYLTRRTQLFNWLGANGFPQDSGEGQLQYLIYENYWVPVNSYHTSAYGDLADFLASTSTNITDLTQEYMYHWEGINDPQVQDRIDAATNFYNAFVNDPGVRYPWTSGNFYCSMTEADFNALLIMDYFLGASPLIPITDADLAAMITTLRKRRRGGWNIVQ